METTTNKTKWVIQPSNSEISFKIKYLMICNIKGVFKNFSGNISTTGEDFMTSEIDFKLNPSSVSTGNEKRDGHLRDKDFFDVDNFKEITFIGKTYQKIDNNGSYELQGELTIKGITKPIKLDINFGGVMKDPQVFGEEKAGFSINGKINRKDWGLTWNTLLETGGLLIGDDVEINCEIVLIKQ